MERIKLTVVAKYICIRYLSLWFLVCFVSRSDFVFQNLLNSTFTASILRTSVK